MNWTNITVKAFQDIHELSLSQNMDEMDRLESIISIMFNKTLYEVGELSVKEFNECAKQCSFLLNDEVPGRPVKHINIGRKKYGIIYNPRKLTHRQYVEILHYSDKPIKNMHLIMASLVQRVRFGFWQKNKAEEHAKIANDMLQARVVDVYHSCIFFCKLWTNSIRVIRSYLVQEMMEQGMTQEQATQAVQLSINVMDGFIAQEKWQNLSV